ncbi:MAG: hypothetical protein K2K91_02805 [Ruminococcus sp.]|nr:hypothetical protein [Ruminococcus sp.]MDE7099085.1 hypothetical protein [Ruminococcus sp.]
MDIKAKVDEIVSKVKNDKDFSKNFKENPTKTIESIIGVDLPDEEVNKIVSGIKAKLTADDIGDKIGGLIGKFKK